LRGALADQLNNVVAQNEGYGVSRLAPQPALQPHIMQPPNARKCRWSRASPSISGTQRIPFDRTYEQVTPTEGSALADENSTLAPAGFWIKVSIGRVDSGRLVKGQSCRTR
ncbi:MAG TPA: hypothetical protein VH419_12210, partial [Nocardioidaceae bacterium]